MKQAPESDMDIIDTNIIDTNIIDTNITDMTIIEKRKKMIVEFMNEKTYVPMKARELAAILQVPKQMKHEFSKLLNELLEEGRISISSRGKYGPAETFALAGILEVNPRGFGFVKVEEREQDIFISADDMKDALQGDKVLIALKSSGQDKKKSEGRIVRVLKRGFTDVIGTFHKNKSFGFVVPDNQKITRDIFVPMEKSLNARSGDKVSVHLTSYGDGRKKPEGVIREILGHAGDPGTDILAVAKSYDLPMDSPADVEKELRHIPDTIDGESLDGRLDIRSWQTVTIDGEDAKDLDDAITLTKEGDRYLLGVHIADVTHYVKEGSPLDREALKRGTSVYLIDRVIPMLPKKLSNGICSLNAGTDRLALSCIMEIDSKGNLLNHKISETVLRVDRRMSYTSVKKILVDRDEALLEEYRDFIPMFQRMEELSSILRKKRFGRGAIDFDFPESKIILNEKGRPIEIKPYERNVATKIIEDFMLIANETVAEDYYWQEIPFVYRVHENPDEEKMAKFAAFINNFGYTLHRSNREIHPKELAKLLEKIEGTPNEPLISRLMLRSMKQAKYSTESLGHFGLSARYYCHFTSPIRRYPDLQIHRIIKENLHGLLNEHALGHYEHILPDVAEQASKTERRAEEAEREVIKLKKVQYMRKHIGDVYEGVISGITAYGMYVELENTVEGMIHVSSLRDDYYRFLEEEYCLVGEMTGRTFKLGERVKIIVEDADPLMKTIDFILYNDYDKEEEEFFNYGSRHKINRKQ